MEVTQGTQNLNGTISLLRNRRTTVRAFFNSKIIEAPALITGQLKVTRRRITGENVEVLGYVDPENILESIIIEKNECNPNNEAAFRLCRRSIDKSLNFTIPLEWTKVHILQELIFELEFSDEYDVQCKETIAPANTCTAEIYLNPARPDPPTVIMYAVPTKSALAGPSAPVEKVSFIDLAVQWSRIQSMLPIRAYLGVTAGGFDLRTRPQFLAVYTFDALAPGSEAITINNITDPLFTANMRMRDFINSAPGYLRNTNTIMLGILPGEPPDRGANTEYTQILRTGGRRSHHVASWYQAGADDDGGDLLSYFNPFRHTGTQQFVHTLGIGDVLKDPDDLSGFCSDANYHGYEDFFGDPERYIYGYDPFPTEDDVLFPDDDSDPANELVPLMGPLGGL